MEGQVSLAWLETNLEAVGDKMGGNGVKGLVVQREKGGERWKKIVFCFALFRSLLLLTTLGKKR